MRIRFVKECGVEGHLYKDGDVVDTADLPAGSLHSLKLLGVYEELPNEPAPEAAAAGENSSEKSEGEPGEAESPVDSNKSSKKGK